MNSKPGQVALRHTLLIAVSVAFLLLLSGTTSPLNPWYGGDSAIFRFVGQALFEGKALYVDIWDHKGPTLFFLQWVAQLIWPGRVGIFVLQTIFLYGTLLCLDSFARRFGKVSLRIAHVCIVLAFYSIVYEHGNLTEEYALLFIAFVLAMLTREWLTGVPTHPAVLALCGAAFAFVVFMRINNALPIFAIFVAYFLMKLLSRAPFWGHFGSAVAGFTGFVAIVMTLFIVQGSLAEMLDAAFFFNIKYAAGETGSYMKMFNNGYVYLALAALVTCVVGGFVDRQRHQRWHFFVLALTVAGCTALALFMSPNAYFHYLQLALPALSIGTVLTGQALSRELWPMALAVVVLISVPLIAVMAVREAASSRHANEDAFANEVEQVLEVVPEAEHDEIYSWNVQSKYYLMAETLPVQRFYTLQEWWGVSDPAVLTESIGHVVATEPRWVLTPAGGPANEEMTHILDDEYSEVWSGDSLALHKRT